MNPAPTLDAYLAAPLGHYFAADTWAHFWAAPDLVGFLLFGRPSAADMRRLTTCFDVELQPRACKLSSICDARRLESVDAAAYDQLHHYVENHHEALSRSLEKQAILRGKGMAGAVNAGFWDVREPPYRVRIFDDTREAYRWLETGSLRLFEELDAIHAGATSQSPLLLQVRAALQGHLADATLGSVATALGLAERTLQRRLSEAGTSFANEIVRERVRKAQDLLRSTDLRIEDVAEQVGCASPQHLALLFRKHVHVSPAEWRERLGRGEE